MDKAFEFSGAFQLMDDFIQRQMTSLRTPGMAIALFDRERCWRVVTYGGTDLGTKAPTRPDTLFEIGSIAKTFTAVAVLQAAEAGLLNLRAAITTYLPWFQVQSAYEPAAYQPITIHHRLNHSAGMMGNYRPITGYSQRSVDAARTWRSLAKCCPTGRLLVEGSCEPMAQNALEVDRAQFQYGYGLEIHTFE